MADYYTLKVKEIIWETGQAATLRLKQPLFSKIKYLPGQFLTFILEINGQKVRRSYSMSSTPELDADLAVTIKRVPGGLVSNYLLDKLKPGDSVEVTKPAGNFVIETDKNKSRHVILIGAGSGITPLMSILRAVLFFEPQSRVSLLYGNRHEGAIIFRRQLDELQAKFADRLTVIHTLTEPDKFWGGYRGRIDRFMTVNVISKLPKLPETLFYLCGPSGMMEEAKEGIKKMGYPLSVVRQESFTVAEGQTISQATGDKDYQVKIRLRGKEYTVEVKAGQTVLNAALDAGLDMPYSCQSGLCTACMGKKIAGELVMEDSDALSASELAQGYVLTCISHPTSEDLVIEI